DASGFLSLLAPEPYGGGGTALESTAALEELGRAAAAGPLVEHAVVAVPLLAAIAPEWLQEAFDNGEILTAAASDVVPYARTARSALIVDDRSIRLVQLVGAEALESLDGSRQLARLDPARVADAAVLTEGPEATPLARAARDRGALGVAASLVGLSARAIEMTVEYTSVRKQFGVPVGSFQAVKHQLANAHVAVEYAGPVVEAAAWAVSEDDGSASRLCSMAKVMAAKAARVSAKSALQCHGAIGYSMEADLHLYLTRIWSLLNAWGSVDHHRERIATMVLDCPVG
ncbi:acyl-CoA dehydrogenase family protein, partial [Pseudonocardia xishanensis]